MKRILIVDDNAELVDMLREGLEGHGYEILTALDGAEALSAAARERPDLIILDIIMPPPDGLEVGKRLKQDPATRGIPVVFLTGLKREEDGGAQGLDGPNFIVAKPIKSSDILKVIRQMLGDDGA